MGGDRMERPNSVFGSGHSGPFAVAAAGFGEDAAFAIGKAGLAMFVDLAEDVIDSLVEIVFLRRL